MRRFTALFNIPELEHYSDDEYDRLMRKAKVRRGDALWVIPAAIGIAGAVVWVGVGVLLTVGLKKSGVGLSGVVFTRWVLLNLLVGGLVAVAIGAVMRWWLLVRSIRRLVNKAGCPFCEFSLIGLRVKKGWTRCPECGQRVFIYDLNLTEDDLIPEHERFRPPPGLGAGELGAYEKKTRAKASAAQRR